MAKLTPKRRANLPKTAFVYPVSRSYPIHDRAHARAALAFSARKNTRGSYAKVAAAVAKKYPDMATSRSSKRSSSSKSTKSRRSASRRR